MKEILITSTVLILALLLLRRLFQKVLSRRVQYALWALVLIRLLVPVTLPASDFSVLTAVQSVETAVNQHIAPQQLPIQASRDPVTEPLTPPEENPSHKAPAAAAPWDKGPAPVRLLSLIWTVGMAGVGGFFFLSNARFYLRLKKVRQPFVPSEPISRRVYLLPDGILSSPCLFAGAIYLTPAAIASPKVLRHVLVHEETHARHRDPLWTLLRCVCLTVYWFDPFVWVAAVCAKADCELACDEGAIALLGETERIPYGQTLLSLVPVSGGPGNPLPAVTTMAAGKRQLKKRITRIAQKPRQLAAAAVTVVVLAGLVSACTFTGASTDHREGYAGPIYSSKQPDGSFDKVLDFYAAQTENEAFGGIFYERDKLIVNIVDGTPGAAALMRESHREIGVEYRSVRYPLTGLQAVVDYLSGYMRQYSILLLDANEVTNQVDIGTNDFSQENLDAIRALVESRFPGMDCLNFEDYRGMFIRFT